MNWGKLTEAIRAHVAGLVEDDYLTTVEWLDSKRYLYAYTYGLIINTTLKIDIFLDSAGIHH